MVLPMTDPEKIIIPYPPFCDMRLFWIWQDSPHLMPFRFTVMVLLTIRNIGLTLFSTEELVDV